MLAKLITATAALSLLTQTNGIDVAANLMADKSSKIKKLKVELQQSQTQVADLSQIVTSLQEQLDLTTEENATLHEAFQTEMKTLKDTYDDLEEEKISLESQLQELETKSTSDEKKIEEVT